MGLTTFMALVIAIVVVGVGTSGPVNADGYEEIPSGAAVVSDNTAPIIECKWELPDANSGLAGIQYSDDDDVLQEPGFPCYRGDGESDRPQMADNVQNVIQVLPNAEDLPEARKIENWVAVEHPNGVDEIDDVFWKVIHPDGTFKFQIHGTKVQVADSGDGALGNDEVVDLNDLGSWNDADTMWGATYTTGQVTSGAVHDADYGIIDLVTQRQKDLWFAEWEISKDQMCGLYTIEVTAVANGAVATMTNTLEIQCFFNLEIDFEDINWGTITPGGTKVLPGDTNFGTAGYPTVKNTGNSGMRVGIEFTELLQDDVLGPKVIDVFDAAFGKNAQVLEWIDPIPANTPVWFSNSSINQVLCANEVGKLDLSIHPPEVVPTGTYSGYVQINAEWAPGVCANDIAAGIFAEVSPTPDSE